MHSGNAYNNAMHKIMRLANSNKYYYRTFRGKKIVGIIPIDRYY